MKNKLINKTKQFGVLLRNGKYGVVLRAVNKRLFSINRAYGLKRDLNAHFATPKAKIDITIREFQMEDEPHFKEESTSFGLVNEDILQCYVAINNDGVPCFKQWLIDSAYNNEISSFFGNSFPLLDKDEALLEGAFTPTSFRGLKIMPAAIGLIAEKSKNTNIRYVITFVEEHNIASLRGCNQSGFSPYVMRMEYWFLFFKITNFKRVKTKYNLHYIKAVA